MSAYKILGVGSNAKTTKGDGSKYLTGIVYLAPAKSVEGMNVCPMAIIAGCFNACLYKAGRGVMAPVEKARVKKTILLRDNPKEFFRLLRLDLAMLERRCLKNNVKPVVRFNGTSDKDIIWLAREFPNIQFYDYSKVYNRTNKALPLNYHLTLSYSEANPVYAKNILNHARANNVNVAVVFRTEAGIPKTFKGMPVISGDKDDLRFLDPSNEPHVIALYAKGPAKKDYSGFVIDA